MFHSCLHTCRAKRVSCICDLHVASLHLTFVCDSQRNNKIASIKGVVFPAGLTMLGLVSVHEFTLHCVGCDVTFAPCLSCIAFYSSMELYSKISLRFSPGLESKYSRFRIDDGETNFGHQTFLNMCPLCVTLCASVR